MRQANLPRAFAPSPSAWSFQPRCSPAEASGNRRGNCHHLSAVRITPAANLEAVRTVKPLMEDWRFVQDDTLTDEQALRSDAKTGQTVSLPHTWNAEDAATTAQSTPTTADYKRGKGWYRLQFVNTGAPTATQWLQFDGASIVADVWLNGTKLGQHRGAFTGFRFDVTGILRQGRNESW
jgi:beta-galactosidase